MASFDIRPAAQSDLCSIRALIRSVRINPLGLDWRRFVVAVDSKGEVIGCGQIKPHWDGSFELASLAVHLNRRERGVGRALIEHLLNSHPSVIYLTCRAELGVFYERFGFRVAEKSEMPPYFRWIWRLFQVLRTLHLVGESLLVMVCDPLSNS
jgi:N-acetylglutamate synthase-like GNAT family acetyltransferase